ncbi:MAG TPA: tetratricopeptide repeat protein [Bryobacteraceae bacterium]|jgi:tetratricopeptide (TPR) repeat protein|nr:tetratricopeptide repeat protein [Bryobacteraceae bacterium]
MRFAVLSLLIAGLLCSAQSAPADFQAERAKANELFAQGRALDALPLYEDLAKRDPNNPAFAERHASGLIAKAATITDDAQKTAALREAYNELLRARSLGDNSNYAQTEIEYLEARFAPRKSAHPTTAPSPGYRESKDQQVIASMQAAEAAFARNDYAAALKGYSEAAAKDPTYYGAPLFAGDTAFRMRDTAKAGEWFEKAIAIDPDRETAYRYWGDALLAANQPDDALRKFADAIIAQPYTRNTWAALQRWSQRTGRPLHPPPARPAACQTLHTVAAVAECARSAADSGIKQIADTGFLECWVLLNAADAQIAQEYAAFRSQHRALLRDYILRVICAVPEPR